jgi:hypothetical protein
MVLWALLPLLLTLRDVLYVQSLRRGVAARKYAEHVRELNKQQEQFGLIAGTIQRVYRGHMGRKRVKNIRSARLSCRVLSYRVLSCRVLSYPVVSCRILSYPVVSCRILSYPVVSCRILSCRIVSYRIVSYRIVSYRIVSYRIVSYRIVSYRIVSYRIVSYCIVLYCIVLYRGVVVCVPVGGRCPCYSVSFCTVMYHASLRSRAVSVSWDVCRAYSRGIAVRHVQRVARGYLGRTKARRLRHNVEVARRKESAAVSLQSLWRMHTTRSGYRSLQLLQVRRPMAQLW